jgi:hypothetical protein
VFPSCLAVEFPETHFVGRKRVTPVKIVELRKWLERRPFVPFTIHMIDGHTIDVADQDASFRAVGVSVMLSHPGRLPEFFCSKHVKQVNAVPGSHEWAGRTLQNDHS